CRFREIDPEYFEVFKSLHTFNISDVELESLQPKVFQEATELTILIASQNKLTEIPSLSFNYNYKLEHVDFSQNIIKKVDPLAFIGADNIRSLDLSQNKLTELSDQLFKNLINLKYLNISHNSIDKFDSNHVCSSKLLKLDLSYNNLTYLSNHLFDRTTEMKVLDLSFNSIGNLNVEIFAFMPNLERLNLRHTKMTSIQLGTFSHQHKLISLDLSENHLKEVNFGLFMPVMHDLKILRLGGNQLSHLNGFRNALFPELTLLDIMNNAFNCSYLQHFMEIIDWKNLHLHFVPRSTKEDETNIRGISCNYTIYEPTVNNNEEKNETHVEFESLEEIVNELKLNSESHDKFVKTMSILIFIVFLAYFVVFIILNRDRLTNLYNKSELSNNQPISATYNRERAETLLLPK
ncbi:toll-like receptor 6, partial [Contarinia nasturtii]|uniref:toll-like receptor 6 n=1 Tax=Contarinia nasturtii TaxID=265458 RepID=UPI0012D46FAC